MVYFFLDFFSMSVYAMSYVCVHAYMCICACMHVYVCMHKCNTSASALLQGMRNKQQTCFFFKKIKKQDRREQWGATDLTTAMHMAGFAQVFLFFIFFIFYFF